MNLIDFSEDIHTMVLLCMETLSKLKFLEIIVNTTDKFERFFTEQFFTLNELNEIFKDYTMLALSGCFGLIKLTSQLKPNCKLNSHACSNAALSGNLEIIKWLRAQNPPCPWSKRTYDCAAESGNLEILMWLHTQNPPCPWGEWTCACAVILGNLEILQWLRAQNPPCP